MASKKTKKEQKFQKELVGEMLKLSTSGLGFVAALAWNDLVKEITDTLLKPLLGDLSGVISLLIYAIVVTILAVTVTYNLARLKEKI